MRRVVTGLCALALVAAGVLLFASAAMASGHKTDVCHKGQIINVATASVPAHEAHGDNVVGPEVCDGVDNDCNGQADEDLVCGFLGMCQCLGYAPFRGCFFTAADCQSPQARCQYICEFGFGEGVIDFECSSVPCPLPE